MKQFSLSRMFGNDCHVEAVINAGGFALSQVRLEQDIHSTKGDLNNTNSNIIGTKDQLSQLETGTSDSISKVHKDILCLHVHCTFKLMYRTHLCGRVVDSWLVRSTPERVLRSPGLGHCVVFLGKTLYSHSAFLHPGV